MNQVITPVKKLLVIDSQVGNWQSLAADVGTDTAVLILDSGSDGLAQISAYLTTLAANTQNFVPLQSLQIISHGSAGSISLGSTTLTTDNLQQYTSQLETIGSALNATGDILLYGCNVAADPVGLDFINQFAALTSADVAASTDLTGATALGGNWVLEAATGTIEAIALQPVYNGILAGAAVINFNKGEVDNPQVASTAGNLGMTQSAYAGFANVAPQSGGLTAGTNAAGAYYEDGLVVGIVQDTSNNIAHVHRGGTVNDRNVMYHSDSSGLYIRALDSSAFSLTSLNFDAVASDENPYATGTYISQSSGESVTSVAGANDYWEILGYASALNPTLDTDANSGAWIARQTLTNGFNGLVTLSSAFENIGAFWIHYAGYQQTPVDGMQFAMSLDNINIAPVNTAPVAVDDSLTATEDTLIIYTAAQLLGNDTDVEGAALTIASVTSGNNGTAVLNADGTVSFTPSANFSGVADFSYVASDSALLSTSATVTVTVVAVNDLPTGTVTISGTPTQGQILTADISTLVDADGLNPATITYQWFADTVAISGAIAATWTLTQEQVGKEITVKASYTDQLLTAEQVTSVATTMVANVNDLPTGTVTISGLIEQNQILTVANTLVDLDGMGTAPITYQWLAGGIAIEGATGETFTLTQAQVNKVITVQASYTDGLNKLEQVLSSATTAVANVNDLPTGTVTISGTPTQGEVLTAANTLADLDGMGTVPITYQWLAGGLAIEGATGEAFTLTQAQVNKVITVQASYTDGLNKLEQVLSSATTAVANVNDLPTGTVTISGLIEQNQILTVANTLVDLDGMGTAPITYQWLAGGIAIEGATGETFTLTQAQVNKVITVQASYTDGLNKLEQVLSSATTTVADVNDLPTGTVTISGTPTQGQILTADISTLVDADGLNPATITYQWFADTVAISGAIAATWTLTQEQVGKEITVKASYTDQLLTAEQVTSVATTMVANVNDPHTGTVTITGTVEEKQILTAVSTLYDIDGMGEISYQWVAGGIDIQGATADTFTLTLAEVGKVITVRASFNDLLGSPESATSFATASVGQFNNPHTGTVTISGTPTQGEMLTAANTLADLDGMGTVPITYQWLAGGLAIEGATGETFTLTQAQVNKVITVQASYTDGLNKLEQVLSSATTAVADVNDLPTGTVTISGLIEQNQILTAANTLVDLDGMGTAPITYQWLAGGIAIEGATGETFTLTQAQVNKAITVQASYTDGLNKLEQVLSSATTTVADANDLPTGTVTISGLIEQNQILTVANTLVDLDGMGTAPITYQWLAGGIAIEGATGETFTLTQAQVNKVITVQASYTDGLNKLEQVLSSATTAVANVNDLPTGTVTISGTPTQGEMLTAANTLADLDGMGTVPITYQWLAGGLAIEGATGETFTLTQAQVNKAITVQASYTDGLNKLEQVLSSATTTVADVNDLPTGTVTISGLIEQNQILTVANTLVDLDGMGTAPITYQWLAGGIAIEGATGETFTLTQAQVNKVITVKASYTDGLNKLEQVLSSATTTVADVNDLPTGTVTISGLIEQNQILTAANTLVDLDGMGTAPITYQWLAGGIAIEGATGETFTLTQAQVNKVITVQASYTDGLNKLEQVLSSATTAVAGVNDLPTGTVTISGTPTQGEMLTAANTLVDLDGMGTAPITYQWLAGGIAIEGATGETFTLTQAQVNKVITVQASYTDGLNKLEQVLSSATTAVANVNDLPTGTVTISGLIEQNQILTAANTLVDLDGMGTAPITYQWLAGGIAIEGATGETFTLTQAQVNKAITVQASYTDGLNKLEQVLSSATTTVADVNDLPTGTVTISGLLEQNQILTVANTLVDLDGMGTAPITYQWLAGGIAIQGATASTLTLSQAEVDKIITVRASYIDLMGTPENVTSSATTAVINVNDAPTTSDVTLLQIFENSQPRVITQAELLGNAADIDNNLLTAADLNITSGQGTLVKNADATWSYTPLLNDSTSVSFSYTITDSVSPTAGTVAAIATLDITPVNVTPEAGLFKSFSNGINTYIKAEAYVQNPGQNLDLDYQIYDKSPDAIVIGSTSNDYINMAGTGNKAANGGGGNDVIDGTTGSSFLSGGDGVNTFFMDGRATGVTWSTLTDFDKGQDKATIWGWVKGVSTINAGYTDFNTGGATGYTGLTLHIQNLLPEGSASGATNSALNSLTLTGHTLAEFGASSLADLNTQIINGTNTHFIVGQTTDNLGVHGYLSIS